MSDRKFAAGRYFKRSRFCLDHDGSKYINAYDVIDGEKNTGISISESGDSAVPNSNKRTVVFQGQEYPLLRDAIIAYEDADDAVGTQSKPPATTPSSPTGEVK